MWIESDDSIIGWCLNVNGSALPPARAQKAVMQRKMVVLIWRWTSGGSKVVKKREVTKMYSNETNTWKLVWRECVEHDIAVCLLCMGLHVFENCLLVMFNDMCGKKKCMCARSATGKWNTWPASEKSSMQFASEKSNIKQSWSLANFNSLTVHWMKHVYIWKWQYLTGPVWVYTCIIQSSCFILFYNVCSEVANVGGNIHSKTW